MNITLQQMKTLDAVLKHGSIQAGAKILNKTHPSVITAIKKMEAELGFNLFDRSGYRSTLTKEGVAFYKTTREILNSINELAAQAQHLARHEEPELNIAIGDITPLPETLKPLRLFSENNRFTRLNLLFENLEGAIERLLEGKADLMIHHINKTDNRLEYKDFCNVKVVPVAATGFLKVPFSQNLKPSNLNKYTQCIIRNTACSLEPVNYFVNNHSPHITVGDQHTKKEIILQGMAWGHMPLFLVEDELKTGRLISIESKYIKSHTFDIVVARLHKNIRGIMAEALWSKF
ncbi:hypothetical protein MNBD_GAMMA09-2241 [hydrothermal vent metagenome]|uniref:HTH lysR-type domain-containing protein n=1 Tax=hydrothermal vent metagenome TaxID=652676 RepID=A0A3B0XYJ8_9ZZZZ